MTKQEFLIESAISYYLNESNTEEVFNFLPEKAKNKLIKASIDDGEEYLQDWEILWCSRNKPGFFKTHIKYLVEVCDEDLTDRQLDILDVEWVMYYFDLYYKVYKKEGDLDFFEKHYEPKFKKYKAKMRDKKIDQILED
jgi:hypothetical protein